MMQAARIDELTVAQRADAIGRIVLTPLAA
jgi:hypothetical protein